MRKTHFANADRPTALYGLDIILAVGYRVNSKRGIAFRRWASTVLKQYLIEGYALNEKRLSTRTRADTWWFYDRYSPLFENLRQLAVEFDSDAANLTKASSNEPNLRQFAVELFSIPWGHHQIIIGKCPSLEESIFYVHETAANGWSRAVLSNFIKSGLFSRQGKDHYLSSPIRYAK